MGAHKEQEEKLGVSAQENVWNAKRDKISQIYLLKKKCEVRVPRGMPRGNLMPCGRGTIPPRYATSKVSYLRCLQKTLSLYIRDSANYFGRNLVADMNLNYTVIFYRSFSHFDGI